MIYQFRKAKALHKKCLEVAMELMEKDFHVEESYQAELSYIDYKIEHGDDFKFTIISHDEHQGSYFEGIVEITYEGWEDENFQIKVSYTDVIDGDDMQKDEYVLCSLHEEQFLKGERTIDEIIDELRQLEVVKSMIDLTKK